jgi:hypothetical protein
MKHIKAKIKRLCGLLLPPQNDAYKFTLIGDRLYTKEPVLVKNSRVKVIKKNSPVRGGNDVVLMDEHYYLLLLHEDNLAHFFHDIFFPLYTIWRMDNKKIFVSINDNQFLRDFLIAVFGQENIYFSNKKTSYKFLNITPTPEGRDLQEYSNYIEICKEIKNQCLSSLGIEERRYKNLLYGRNELARKNLLEIDSDFLQEYSIEQVALSRLTFKEMVTLMSEAKSFIYMVGAGVFYLLFLDTNVRALEINPVKNNSWAKMFGMERLCRLTVLISQNTQASEHPAQGDQDLDHHVYFDESIKKAIMALLSKI